ncbi:MAG: RraA family protein [Anaerolineales bacterium]|jgi:regulator of RNase E activity RraA
MKKQISIYPETKSHTLTPSEKEKLLGYCEEFKELSGGTAACSDILDFMGYRRGSMDLNIKPYFPEKGRLCGLAYTIRGANIPGLPPGTKEVRETVDVEYYDGIQPGYVLVYGTNAGDRGTIIGDVIATFASSRGAIGAVCDGPIRDLERIQPLNFLPFGPSAAPISGEGRVLWIEYDCIVQVGGIWVEPYDIIYGDMDGVVVIPKHLAEKILMEAKAICEKEDAIKASFLKHRDKKLFEIFAMHDRRP